MTASATPEPGGRVGSYVLERRLGAGGMGEVWLGRHAVSGGLGAVKLLRRDARDRGALLEYFRREARLISGLRHPHIVAVFEIGESHLVYQYIDGQDLARRLRTPIDPAEAIRLTRQIASALAHAHARGLVHRDVKPGNVLLDKAGHAFLADFGLAVEASERADGGAGTPGYAAPEQWTGAAVGPAADQFALGRTLCEMLVGGALPADPTASAAELPASLPGELRAIVARATAAEPSQRFASLAAFEAALAAVDVSAHAPPQRLAPEVRPRGHYAYCAAPEAVVQVAPELWRADHRLRALAAAGLVPGAAAERFFAETGYAEFGFSLYAASARLGPITEPGCMTRAAEVVVLMHGWAATREVWEHVAPALCRDNAQAVVLAVDFWGFGESPFAGTPTAEQIGLPAAIEAIRRLLRLLGLADLPTVLVGHSLSATGLLMCSDRDLGAATSRVAINPVLPAYSAAYRKRARMGIRMARTIGKIPVLRRWMMRKLARDAPSVQELTLEVRERMVRDGLAAPASLFPAMFETVLAVPRIDAGPHHHVLLLIGDNDPLIAEEALAAAVEDMRLSPAQLVRLATGGHYPHLESAAHPEWTARNVAEIVHRIGEMLLSASQCDPPTIASASTVISGAARSDGPQAVAATVQVGPLAVDATVAARSGGPQAVAATVPGGPQAAAAATVPGGPRRGSVE